MQVVVPFAAREPKTRLAPVLDDAERRAFAQTMLADVLDALADCGRSPTVLATAPVSVGHEVVVDDRPLTTAVNDVLERAGGEPVAVVMADLALATPEALGQLFAPDADVVLAPGRGGGTNAFCTRHPSFRVDYHDASIRDHRQIASEIDATCLEVDSYRLATDVDEPGDLVEVLLHGLGRAADWLRDHDFTLDAEFETDRPRLVHGSE